MSGLRALEALQALHCELLAFRQHRFEDVQTLEELLAENTKTFRRFLDKKKRDQESRRKLGAGKIALGENGEEEYEINSEFVDDALKVAEELDLDELEAARLLLDAAAEGDHEVYGRPLWACGVMRFHQERRFLLDCMRLMIEIAGDEDLEDGMRDAFGDMVALTVYQIGAPGTDTKDKFPIRCMDAMVSVRQTLQAIGQRMTAKSLLAQASLLSKIGEDAEVYEFARVSLVEQHELLAVILSSAVEAQLTTIDEFKDLIEWLKRADKYDHLLIHLLVPLGAFISVYTGAGGMVTFEDSRKVNKIICNPSDDEAWTIPSLRAAVRAWWIAEYSGWFLDDAPVLSDPAIDMDQEDKQRTEQFFEALKDGAFEFILSAVADCRAQEWQDPTRQAIRQWIQRKSMPLASDFQYPFDEFFQNSLVAHLEVFIDSAITNLPDVLRKLRLDEDQQRTLNFGDEQDFDLERLLMIIAYTYEGRPDAAMSFWEDPESNLAGFLQWASRRASTPLVSTFCEMLQALSGNDECATAAHMFLLDEGHHSSGKMRRTQTLTWDMILNELVWWSKKVCERPNPAQANIHRAPAKAPSDPAETEPEAAMMLECYLRLIAKVSGQSEAAREKMLWSDEGKVLKIVCRLASGLIPPRLRACVFDALRELGTGNSQKGNDWIFEKFEEVLMGRHGLFHSLGQVNLERSSADVQIDAALNEFSNGFEQPYALVRLLTALMQQPEGDRGLNDSLPFPERLAADGWPRGVDAYVDFVFGNIFSSKIKDTTDLTQLRMFRLSCLEFALTCLATFNEDLIVLGNQTNVNIDEAIGTRDLETYVCLHPFGRVMEWMFQEKVISGIMATIHEDPRVLSMARPGSLVIESILRAVEVTLKVLELQDTYLHLVRPVIAQRPKTRRRPIPHSAFGSLEEGLMNHLSLVVDLGRLCALGNPELTVACLKLLEKISTSPKIISAWSPEAGGHGHRNKAIVQLEKNGENEAIANTLSGEISAPLDPFMEAEAPNYSIKIFILDFLYECLKASPDRPTIAHLLLGFQCKLDALSVEPRGAFDSQKSLFHKLLTALIPLSVYEEERGVRGFLVALRYRILRVFQVLWSSPLSARLVMEELRETNFLFHMLLRETQIQPGLAWDGEDMSAPEFPLSEAAVSYINFLSARAIVFEYISKELCSVSQRRIPTIKRQIFDALNGQIKAESDETLQIPSVFDFFDFLNMDGRWDVDVPQFEYYKDLDLTACATQDPDAGLQYDTRKVQEVLALKRNEQTRRQEIVSREVIQAIMTEEQLLVDYLVFSNRQKQYMASRLKLLKAWSSLLLVMFETSDYKGTAKMAFLLQALQALLPSLEAYSALSAAEAYELARVAKVLLFKLDMDREKTTDGLDNGADGLDKDSYTMGNLMSDKLFQLFQLCLDSVCKWTGSAELRALWYSICYRYLTGVVDRAAAALGPAKRHLSETVARQRTLKAIHAHGDRLFNVICDDAYGSDALCQTSAMILLGALVRLGRADDDMHVVEALNRLNFVGVLVDSLRTILQEWLVILAGEDKAAEQYVRAKLALLLQLCQTRQGAKYVVQANLFRALDMSGVFAADPELEMDAADVAALERHYALLVALARIVSAAVMARGAHNVIQGRRFLTQHRGLVVHALKRSAGIGAVGSSSKNKESVLGGKDKKWEEARERLEERIEELAEAFMLLITATGFLEVCFFSSVFSDWCDANDDDSLRTSNYRRRRSHGLGGRYSTSGDVERARDGRAYRSGSMCIWVRWEMRTGSAPY
ncbi:nucleoporin Nup186/Nup192/Nup205 [Echria macrotheca]|uniref:Nucleoporin Nup186/Nup192/Nup205 n=1 Tax=Echria macrotheca TaxID=438768 RepID=A0AAJ0BFF8_9PEZI|nr:nucleoporin Nup186/Nup192/Nup205 [Echria macrotheca]